MVIFSSSDYIINFYISTDTAFMYIIGGLIIVKLIHMRDSTISINAFLVFISLGVIILFTVVGIVSHCQHVY